MEDKYENIYSAVCSALPRGAGGKEAKLISPLVLAYIGDTVYDLYVRTSLIEQSDLAVRGLHRLSAQRVCAAAQSAAYRRISPMLSEEEQDIYKRGRNSHMGTVPKHAAIADYRAATGLEALLGYLYLSGRDGRLKEIMSLILSNEGEEVEK